MVLKVDGVEGGRWVELGGRVFGTGRCGGV